MWPKSVRRWVKLPGPRLHRDFEAVRREVLQILSRRRSPDSGEIRLPICCHWGRGGEIRPSVRQPRNPWSRELQPLRFRGCESGEERDSRRESDPDSLAHNRPSHKQLLARSRAITAPGPLSALSGLMRQPPVVYAPLPQRVKPSRRGRPASKAQTVWRELQSSSSRWIYPLSWAPNASPTGSKNSQHQADTTAEHAYKDCFRAPPFPGNEERTARNRRAPRRRAAVQRAENANR